MLESGSLRLCALLILPLLTLQSVIAAPAEPTASRPNVLLLIADDLNNSLGCYGHPIVKSPQLDRLSSQSVTFEHAYCQFPLCGPSRNSMLTGLYPNSTGIVANAEIFRDTIPQQRSLPHAFRDADYFSARVGKLFHYSVPKSMGTDGHDDPASWELALNPVGCDRLLEEGDIFSLTPGSFGGTLSWYASPREDKLHTDAKVADDAIWILERCAKDQSRPFFLGVGFFRPHTPYVAPQKYFDLYPLDQMPIVTESVYKADQKDIPAAALESKRTVQDKMTDLQRREAIQAYYASISFMDAQAGRILAALDRLGLADNTIVLFTSDHGYHLGEHGLWQKLSLFEQSAKVPLMIRAPGQKNSPARVSAPVGLIDVYPTLTELCAVTPPENLQGQSLAPMLTDPQQQGRGWTLSQVLRNRKKGTPITGYSVRTKDFRYTLWADEGEELYDHRSDSFELTNLADDHKHAKTVQDLKSLLQAQIKNSFPESGVIPSINRVPWNPNLTEP